MASPLQTQDTPSARTSHLWFLWHCHKQIPVHGQWSSQGFSSCLPSQVQAGRLYFDPFSNLLQAFSEAKDSKKPSSPTWSRSGTSPHNSTGPTSPLDDRLEPGALVFFSLKVDPRTQNIMEMAAVNGDHSFRTLIQTPESVLALLPEGIPLEVGVQYLLWFLSLLPRPILIIWNFWGLELPAVFKALDATGRKVDFCHVVCGYMDMLSLVKDRVPQAPSYRLNNLLRRYLQQRLGESALAKAKALQNLWGALALPVSLDMEMMLTHRNAQSYTLLWPFVQEKLLTKRVAKVLAQRNLILRDLEEE